MFMAMACVLIELKDYEITSQSSYGKTSKDREKINFLLSREKKIYERNCKFLENNFLFAE